MSSVAIRCGSYLHRCALARHAAEPFARDRGESNIVATCIPLEDPLACGGLVGVLVELPSYGKTHCMVCGSNSKGNSTRGIGSGTTDRVQARRQPEDSQGTWDHHSCHDPRPCR